MMTLACSYPARSHPVAAPLVATNDLPTPRDPTVHGARLVPATIDLSAATPDATGALRGVVMGVRFLAGPGEGVRTSPERLDDTSATLPLPPRLGGGFLFVVGDTVLRADSWLGHLRPLYRARVKPMLFVGLDRVYVRWGNGSHSAFDPLSGLPLDLGPWPADPFVGAYAALDGWCAFALTDLQGVVVTRDAGRNWTHVDLPIEAERFVAVRRESEHDGWATVAAGGIAEAVVASDRGGAPGASGGAAHCVLVTPALEVVPFASCDEVHGDGRGEFEPPRHEERSALRAAVEDGWPLRDGTALVAESGRLSWVSLRDGTVVARVDGAFDSGLSRCHALSLARPEAPNAIGFVCGEREGRTVVLSKDDDAPSLAPIRSFPTPRVVQASAGNWLVHGGCDDVASDVSRYCVGARDAGGAHYEWTTHEVLGAATAVGLTNEGRLVVLSAAAALEVSHLLLYPERGVPTAIPLHLSELSERMRRLLRRGVWVGGLTAHGGASLDGWVAADSTVVGVAIDLDGTVHAGPWVGDLGSPFVAGEYGLGWTRSHRGYETTDGGRTWAQFAAPTLLAPSKTRGCGPVGCSADGWLRIGWGDPVADPPRHPEAAPIGSSRPPTLTLSCQPADKAAAQAAAELGKSSGQPHGGEGANPPHLARGEVRVREELHPIDGGLSPARYGSVYAWGPSTGDWMGRGRWLAEWRSPFAATPASWSATEIAPAPFADAAMATGVLSGHASNASVTVGNDPSHALLVRRTSGKPPELAGMEAGGRLWPIVRDDGEPWASVDAALRIMGDWYVAVPSDSRRSAIDIFRAEPRGARRLARVARHLSEPALGQVRLAHGVDGNQLGLVVDGEPQNDRGVPRRWVVPIDLDTGLVGPPESLGSADLGDRDSVAPCVGAGGGGWLLDTTWPNAEVTLNPEAGGDPSPLHQVYARFRISSDRVCVEAMAGEARLSAPGLLGTDAPARSWSNRGIAVVTTSGTMSVELRCEPVPR